MINIMTKYKEAFDKSKQNDMIAQQQVFTLRSQIHILNTKLREFHAKNFSASADKPIDLSLIQDRNKLTSSVSLYQTSHEERLYNDILKYCN